MRVLVISVRLVAVAAMAEPVGLAAMAARRVSPSGRDTHRAWPAAAARVAMAVVLARPVTVVMEPTAMQRLPTAAMAATAVMRA